MFAAICTPEGPGVPLDEPTEATESIPGGPGEVLAGLYEFWKELWPIDTAGGRLVCRGCCPLIGRGEEPMIPPSYTPWSRGDAAEDTEEES
jgi:hypothetical protein